MSRFYKRICLFAVLAVVLVSTGCTVSTDSDDISHESTNIGKNKEKKEPVDNVKIEDLEWYIEEGILKNDRYELFSYTNNSDYVIKNFTINLLQKESVTEDDIANVHGYIKEALNCSDEDIEWLKSEEFGIQARSEVILYPGQSIENQYVFYYKGIVYVKAPEHMELVEPDIATIEYIKDDKIYTEYYDFKTGKYSLDSEVEKAFQWPESSVAKKLPKPEVLILEDSYSDEDYINCEAFGVSLNDFNDYVSLCKEYGFTEDMMEHEGFYSADDVEGYDLMLSYDNSSNSMSVILYAP